MKEGVGQSGHREYETHGVKLARQACVVVQRTVFAPCRSVEEASDRFYAELRRHFYTTPKSYLDLISSYLQLLQERK